MSFFNTISKNDVVFLTPLIVATAPLSLLYILLCKTQGRSVNTFDDRNREVCVFLLLFVASAIGEVARSARGEVREKIYVVISVRCSIRTEYRAYIATDSPLLRVEVVGSVAKMFCPAEGKSFIGDKYISSG